MESSVERRNGVPVLLGVRVFSSAREPIGAVDDILIDPVTRRLTHLVVGGPRWDAARLVPVDLVARIVADTASAVSLACTRDDFADLPPVQVAHVWRAERPVAAPRGDWEVGAEDPLVLPDFGTIELGDYAGETQSVVGVSFDWIPGGTVELRRSSAVESDDGHLVGHMRGVLVDGWRITHVVLERSHLFTTVTTTVPVESVALLETDRIRLSLAKDSVDALPRASRARV